MVIPPGSTAATVTVRLNGDEKVEPAESFFVQLEDATNAEIEDGRAVITLLATPAGDTQTAARQSCSMSPTPS